MAASKARNMPTGINTKKFVSSLIYYLTLTLKFNRIKSDLLFQTNNAQTIFNSPNDHNTAQSQLYNLNSPLFIAGQRQVSQIHISALGAISIYAPIGSDNLDNITDGSNSASENIIIAGKLLKTPSIPNNFQVSALYITDSASLSDVEISHSSLLNVELWEAYIFTWIIDNTVFQIVLAATNSQDKVYVVLNVNDQSNIYEQAEPFSGIYVYNRLTSVQAATFTTGQTSQTCKFSFIDNFKVQVTDISNGISCFSAFDTLCPGQPFGPSGRLEGLYITGTGNALTTLGNFGYRHTCFNGQKMDDNFPSGEELVYCDYDPDAYTAGWESLDSFCEVMTCSVPVIPENAIVLENNDEHTLGKQIVYECQNDLVFIPSNQPRFTTTCNNDPNDESGNTLVYDALETCETRQTKGDETLAPGQTAATPVETTTVETLVIAEFDVDIPCNPNEADTKIDQFKASFAGLILPLQQKEGSNYEEFSVTDITCDDSSNYQVQVRFNDVRPASDVVSYDDMALIANEYLSAFRDYVVEQDLSTQLARDVGGTKSVFEVKSVSVGDGNNPPTIIPELVIKAKNNLQEIVSATAPVFNDDGTTKTSFTMAMEATALVIQNTFNELADKQLTEGDSTELSTAEVQAEIDLTNNFMETMTNVFDEWTRSTPELNNTKNALVAATQISNNIITLIEKSAATTTQIGINDPASLVNSDGEATTEDLIVKSDVANSYLQSMEDLMSYMVEQTDFTQVLDGGNSLDIQTESSALSGDNRMELSIQVHDRPEVVTAEFGAVQTDVTNRKRRSLKFQESFTNIFRNPRDSLLNPRDIRNSLRVFTKEDWSTPTELLSATDFLNRNGKNVIQVSSGGALNTTQYATDDVLNTIDTSENRVNIEIPELVMRNAIEAGKCGGPNASEPFYTQRIDENSNTIPVTNYLNVNREVTDGIVVDGQAYDSLNEARSDRNSRLYYLKNQINRHIRDTSELAGNYKEVVSTQYLFTDKCWFTIPQNQENEQNNLISEAPCMSTRICGERSMENLAEPIKLSFTGKFSNNHNKFKEPRIKCSYWDDQNYVYKEDGIEMAEWSWDKQTLEYSITCKVSHLTTFTIFFFEGASNESSLENSPLFWYDLITSVLVTLTLIFIIAIYSHYHHKYSDSMKLNYKNSLILFSTLLCLISVYLGGQFIGSRDFPLEKVFSVATHFIVVCLNNFFMLSSFCVILVSLYSLFSARFKADSAEDYAQNNNNNRHTNPYMIEVSDSPNRTLKFLFLLSFLVPAVITAINVGTIFAITDDKIDAKKSYSKLVIVYGGLKKENKLAYFWPKGWSIYGGSMAPCLVILFGCAYFAIKLLLELRTEGWEEAHDREFLREFKLRAGLLFVETFVSNV